MDELNQDHNQINSEMTAAHQAPIAPSAGNTTEQTIDLEIIKKQEVKQHNKKYIVILGLVVLVSTLIGAFGFIYWQQVKQNTANNTLESKKDSNISSSQALSTEYKTTVKDVYDLIKKENAASVSYTTDNTVAPLYKAEGSKYYLYANNPHGLVVYGTSSENSDWNAYLGNLNSKIISYLSSHKYNKVTTDGYTYYISSESVCRLPDVAGGVPAYFSCANIASYAKTDGTKPVDSSSELKSADETITAVYRLISSINAQKVMVIKPNFAVSYGPVYKPSGAIYNLATNKNVALDITTNELQDNGGEWWERGWDWGTVEIPIYSDIDIFLTSHGFKKNEKTSDVGGEVAVYSSSTVICIRLSDPGVDFVCANISDYPSSVDGVEQFNSVLADIGIGSDTYAFGKPIITNSAVSGYQNASMGVYPKEGGVGGFVVLLYKKVGDNWKYFTSAQQALGCDAYNTAELKAAFAGKYCYDSSNKDSVVK